MCKRGPKTICNIAQKHINNFIYINFISEGPTDNKSSLVQVMVWHRNMWQAITKVSDDQVVQCLVAL